ncbi:nucleotidyltransferase domain-containing protein [Gottfriedia acidiceleris]|uniref:Nucleotidyltransferase domain-containing protein n=1 Tax=Gottfriedia acidiceleris TaxID=371036 RepID=A0ABY4JIU7_9BACI|nr:nucleotidyltransferase domain-containing protein [Gottfriedia acidiceleris]UPM53541.1 nucleotidyltransferase domain-containing protein [Gottfriedia acidiceleris]
MKEIISEKLKQIEVEHDVKILFAVESGSRAWGFPSKDSDYDVRFVYVHRKDWYLSINQKRDVIEYPINDLLDFSGWDLKKALNLFAKSNPALLEWLRSPIVYHDDLTISEELRKIGNEILSKKACIYHYLHMAKGNYRDYLQGEEVKIKKYFYVLRPILACIWIQKHNEIPPILFDDLLEMKGLEQDFLEEVEKLLIRKKQGEELDREPRKKVLNDFIEHKIQFFEEYVKGITESNKVNIENLNELFRTTIEHSWGKIE